MGRSDKPTVIEWIFFNLKYDDTTGQVEDPVVTFDDIQAGIDATGVPLSKSNPANFWKDLTRKGVKGLNAIWPSAIFEAGFTATDAIGQGNRAVFRFQEVPDGQEAPFVDALPFDGDLPVHRLESLSMPQAMRAMGRSGENWHAQVADRLRVVATYFALGSPRSNGTPALREVNFLQTGIKMHRAETDAAFSLVTEDDMWLISAEVKGRRESFHLPQIARAAHNLKAAADNATPPLEISGVIPLGIKVVAPSRMWVVEFAPIDDPDEPLQKVGEMVIELTPAVPGVD
ncbi:hypothetical protein M3C60_006200 [Micrococcus luteus]|nr:hypothetical protein [Micrococcus luteus]MCV7467118.1 hypothetical protein [Micrococcus luteus]